MKQKFSKILNKNGFIRNNKSQGRERDDGIWIQIERDGKNKEYIICDGVNLEEYCNDMCSVI